MTRPIRLPARRKGNRAKLLAALVALAIRQAQGGAA